MANLVKSARGSLVDFDLMKIKQQMADAPTTTNVAARQNFIDNKLKRRLKKQTQEVVDSTVSPVVVSDSDPVAQDAIAVDAGIQDGLKILDKKEKK